MIILLVSCKNDSKEKNVLSKSKIISQTRDSLTNDLQNIYKKGGFVGFSVAIVNQDSTLYAEGFGYAKKEIDEKYTSRTVQNIASISKTMIGISLLKAQEQGLLNVEDNINKYLPFKVINPHYPSMPITIKHLATHSSTITDTDYYNKKTYLLMEDENISDYHLPEIDEKFNNPSSRISMEAFLHNLLSIDGEWYQKDNYLNNKPGDIFEYSNIGATLTALIIEKVSNTTYDNYVKQNILVPLKMDESGWSMKYNKSTNVSIAYFDSITPLPKYTYITYPDGGIMTNTNDLSFYLKELINAQMGKGTLISNGSYKKIFTKYLNDKQPNESYDYDDELNSGLFMGFTPNKLIGHTGGDPGVATAMFFNPNNKVGIILLINTSINNDDNANQFFNILNTLSDYGNKIIKL